MLCEAISIVLLILLIAYVSTNQFEGYGSCPGDLEGSCKSVAKFCATLNPFVYPYSGSSCFDYGVDNVNESFISTSECGKVPQQDFYSGHEDTAKDHSLLSVNQEIMYDLRPCHDEYDPDYGRVPSWKSRELDRYGKLTAVTDHDELTC